METTSILTDEFYKRLYNEIIDNDFGPCDEEDNKFNLELTFDEFTVNLDATMDVHVVDESFDHAFGTEYIYSLEVGDLVDIEIESVCYDDGNEEKDITDLFDYDAFWEQFKQYGTDGIKPNDEVIAKLKNGRWGKFTYLFTNTLTREHVCKYGDKPYTCSFIAPMNENNAKLIGKF